MAMPAKQRERLSTVWDGQMVATIDTQSRCLLIYPLATWEELEQEIQKLPSLNPKVRSYQRLIIGYATDLEFDGSGRVLLPPSLREYAGLEKKVVLVGQVKKFELWSEELWIAERDKALKEANSGELPIPEEMLSLSL
jgi:MraZ protein